MKVLTFSFVGIYEVLGTRLRLCKEDLQRFITSWTIQVHLFLTGDMPLPNIGLTPGITVETKTLHHHQPYLPKVSAMLREKTTASSTVLSRFSGTWMFSEEVTDASQVTYVWATPVYFVH